jgi:hypothetical protein
MSESANPSPTAPASPKTKAFVALLRILARAVLALFLLSLIAALLPLQLQSPLWYLKAGQVAVDYSVTLLFAIFLFFMVEYLRSRDEGLGRQSSPAFRISLMAIIMYGLIVPMMLFAYGLYWLQAGEQTKQALAQAQREVATLQKRIRDATSDRELLQILSPQGAGVSAVEAPSLMPQKAKLNQQVGDRLVQLRSNLADRRQSQLSILALGAAKGVLGAIVVVVCLVAIRSAVVPP